LGKRPTRHHGNEVEAIRAQYRNWSAAREGAFELQCAGAAEVGRIAQELGLSSFELRALVSHPDDRKLLAKRMAGVRLEPKAVFSRRRAADLP
jgi:hypothetical protein